MNTRFLRSFAPFVLLAGWDAPAAPPKPACDAGNAGLTLPSGFCALLVRDNVSQARHIAIAPNGDIFVAHNSRPRNAETQGAPDGGGLVLRDTTGDGKADIVSVFYTGASASGIALAPDAVYLGLNDRVLRFAWTPGSLTPSGEPEVIATGLPTGGHAAKGLALGPDGALFVSFGSRTNSCQPPDKDRTGPVPGLNPCPELAERAGVWRFDAKKTNQTPADARRWATGLRNPMALSIQPGTGMLHAGVHGRDQLAENWSWSAEEGRENPAETVYALAEGADAGWPYCFFDSRKKVRLQNPEYGGDGTKVGDCDKKAMPALSFPGHWAPMSTVFSSGTQFPAAYREGMFVAFHGSWNRAPAPQEGFRVVFAPFKGGKAAGTYETFIAPAEGPTAVRPTGLAMGPDGSLYLSADREGKIWRILYRP